MYILMLFSIFIHDSCFHVSMTLVHVQNKMSQGESIHTLYHHYFYFHCRSLPALIKFLAVGSTLHLDGFLFELPGKEFYRDVQSFGQGICRVLKCISDADPAGYCCMNKSFLSKIGWSFEFNKVPIFVTTFSACYPENHSRCVY